MLSRPDNFGSLLEYAAAKLAGDILRFSKNSKNNPTTQHIKNCVALSTAQGEPVKLLVTQGLQASAELQKGWISHLLNCPVEPRNISAFAVQTYPIGWLGLRNLVDELAYPFDITFLLDDIALRTMYACDRWCSGQELARFENEAHIWRNQIEEQAKNFFAGGFIKVEMWSSRYGVFGYEQALRKVSDWNSWAKRDETGLVETCLELDCSPFRSRGLYRELGLESSEMRQVILSGLLGMVANFRLQADTAIKQESLLVWTQGARANSFWPVVLSNYDGQGYAASLVL